MTRTILMVAFVVGTAMAARVVDREGNYYLCDKGQYAYFVYDKDTADWSGDYQLRVFEVTKDKHVTRYVIWDCGFAETYDDALVLGKALKEKAERRVMQQNREMLAAGQGERRSPHLTAEQTEMVIRQVEEMKGSTQNPDAESSKAELDSLHRRTELNPASSLGKWGYTDSIGNVFVIAPQFDNAKVFSEGLAAVGVGEYPSQKWGYIDMTGKLVINPRFDDAKDFSEGLAAVEMGEYPPTWGYIDKTGKYVIKLQFADAQDFSEGLAAVGIGDYWLKWGYIDKTGKFVIAPRFLEAGKFSGGRAKVVTASHEDGFIDATGTFTLLGD